MLLAAHRWEQGGRRLGGGWAEVALSRDKFGERLEQCFRQHAGGSSVGGGWVEVGWRLGGGWAEVARRLGGGWAEVAQSRAKMGERFELSARRAVCSAQVGTVWAEVGRRLGGGWAEQTGGGRKLT